VPCKWFSICFSSFALVNQNVCEQRIDNCLILLFTFLLPTCKWCKEDIMYLQTTIYLNFENKTVFFVSIIFTDTVAKFVLLHITCFIFFVRLYPHHLTFIIMCTYFYNHLLMLYNNTKITLKWKQKSNKSEVLI
jgi:hypothetical protein